MLEIGASTSQEVVQLSLHGFFGMLDVGWMGWMDGWTDGRM